MGESLNKLKDFMHGKDPYVKLINYLDSLKLEELKIIDALMLTGRDVLEKVDFEEELYEHYYKYANNNKDALVGYISEKLLRLDDYLKTGLENCL
jgi:hypothetical protein